MLAEIIGLDEGQDVGLEGLKVRIVEGLDGGLLDGAVHPFGLAVGPGMIGFGELVLDAVLAADTVEDVAHPLGGGAIAVFWQVGEGHAVVGQHGVDGIGEGGHDLAEKGGTVQLGCGRQESDVGELGHPVDGEEHEELTLGQAQLADVDMDVADGGFGEALTL